MVPVVEKRCTRCGQVVSSNSKVGDVCPHCGARFSFEQGVDGQVSAAPSQPSTPVPTSTTPTYSMQGKLPWILGGTVGMGVVFLGVLAVVIVILKNRF
jgi:hypothetical protein